MLAFGALPDSLFRRNAYGELWIIDAGSIRADQDSIHTVTQIMHPHASFRSADPVGIARMCCQLAIKRHGPFRRYIGPTSKNIVLKRTNDLRTLGREQIVFQHHDLDSCRTKLLTALQLNLRIGIERADDHAPDTCGNDGIGARRCVDVNVTGFERYIQVCAFCSDSRPGEGLDFGMWSVGRSCCSLRDNLAVAHHNCSDRRTWTGA